MRTISSVAPKWNLPLPAPLSPDISSSALLSWGSLWLHVPLDLLWREPQCWLFTGQGSQAFPVDPGFILQLNFIMGYHSIPVFSAFYSKSRIPALPHWYGFLISLCLPLLNPGVIWKITLGYCVVVSHSQGLRLCPHSANSLCLLNNSCYYLWIH